MFTAWLLALSLASAPSTDSVTVTVKPRRPEAATMGWVAFDDARRPIGRGTAPGTISQASDGTAVTYCAAKDDEWIELTVDLRGGVMRAYGHCTRVTVKGKAVKTLGVADPRLAAP